MKKSEMKEFKELLVSLRARLRGDVEQLKSEALSGSEGNGDAKSPTHLAELGTDAYEQDFSLRFVENDEETLNEIQIALKKIREGSFGLCEGCIEEGNSKARSRIAKPRLRAIPYCRNCIKCERKREEMAL
jgi:DnaK suppressor protein